MQVEAAGNDGIGLAMMARRSLLSLLVAGAAMPRVVSARGTPPRVVASFSILADIAREVAPADFEIGAVVGPDSDAHVFVPRPSDARRLAQADLAIVNGLGFEGWIDRLVAVSGYGGSVVVASQRIVPLRRGHHGVDPHAWQSPVHARSYVDVIADALTDAWPRRRSEILARSAGYRARLDRLHTEARAAFDAIPRDERRVMTSHAAFAYLGAAYDIEFVAPQGWSAGSEPSAAAVARLVTQIREQRVRALFIENISDPRLVQSIARDTGVRVGGTLYSDALSAPGGPADSYLELVQHNVRTLVAALGS